MFADGRPRTLVQRLAYSSDVVALKMDRTLSDVSEASPLCPPGRSKARTLRLRPCLRLTFH
jgi:hypothetical protein